jgi:hypothetical protein
MADLESLETKVKKKIKQRGRKHDRYCKEGGRVLSTWLRFTANGKAVVEQL